MNRTEMLARMETIQRTCEQENRAFTDAEQQEWQSLKHSLENSTEHKSMPVVSPNIVTSKNAADTEYSLHRVMHGVANQRGLEGLEAETDQELKSQQPWREFNGIAVPAAAIMVPQKKLAKIMTKASAVVGPGNLAPLVGIDHRDELFAQISAAIGDELIGGKIGGMTLAGLKEQTVRIPRQDGPMSVGYVALDADLPTSSDPTFSNQDMTPHLVGGVTEVKLSSFMAQHPATGTDWFAAELRRALVEAMDDTLLNGDSATTAAQPDGLLSLATDSGVEVAHSTAAQDLLIQVLKVFRDYVHDNWTAGKWIMDADVIDGFRTIEAYASQNGASSLLAEAGISSNVMLGLGMMGTTKYEVTTGTPDSTAGLLLDGSTVVQGLWESIDVSVNPYADSVFASGGALVRVFAMHDVAVIDPGKVVKFTTDLQTTTP